MVVFSFSPVFFKRCIENKSCSHLRGDITEPLQIEEYLKSINVFPSFLRCQFLDKLIILQITIVKLRHPSADSLTCIQYLFTICYTGN